MFSTFYSCMFPSALLCFHLVFIQFNYYCFAKSLCFVDLKVETLKACETEYNETKLKLEHRGVCSVMCCFWFFFLFVIVVRSSRQPRRPRHLLPLSNEPLLIAEVNWHAFIRNHILNLSYATLTFKVSQNSCYS